MKIAYILGRGRSGSTILANVLGEVPGFFSAGEVRELWDPVVKRGNACGCGAPLPDCPVWSQVLTRLEDVDPEEAVRWQHEIVKESNVYRLLRCAEGCEWPALTGYARVMGSVYAALAEVTGARVIVDSSKRPSYGAFLRAVPGCDLYFVHLTRDPRASAHSWRSRRYELVRGGQVKQRNAIDSTLRWDLLNAGAEALLKRVPAGRRMRLRFEDFTRAPRDRVDAIVELLGETGAGSPFLDERTVTLGPNHTIAGNPSRFRTGRLEIRDAEDWRTEQDAWSRWSATAIALPYLRRYGYGIRP